MPAFLLIRRRIFLLPLLGFCGNWLGVSGFNFGVWPLVLIPHPWRAGLPGWGMVFPAEIFRGFCNPTVCWWLPLFGLHSILYSTAFCTGHILWTLSAIPLQEVIWRKPWSRFVKTTHR